MADRKLLWILLGLSFLIMVSARSANEEDFEEVEVEEDEDEYDDDEGCDPTCEKKCHRLKCQAGTVRDYCGCCSCAQNEDKVPKIVSGPTYHKNYTGGSAALSCEISGYPIPFISWLRTNVNNETTELPGDDRSIMTLNQGGPEKHEITAWVQIMTLRKEHEGDYSCVAFNRHGKAKATGRLKVSKGKKKKKHHHKNE